MPGTRLPKHPNTKVAIIDLDGTLVEHAMPLAPLKGTKVRAHAKKMMDLLQRRGYQIYIITGRSADEGGAEFLKRRHIPFKVFVPAPRLANFVYQDYLNWKEEQFRAVKTIEQTPGRNVILLDDRQDVLDLGTRLGFKTLRVERDEDWLHVKNLISTA